MNKLFSGINIFYKKDKYKMSYIKPKKQCKNCHFIIKNSINVKWPFKCICYRRKNDATIKIQKMNTILKNLIGMNWKVVKYVGGSLDI